MVFIGLVLLLVGWIFGISIVTTIGAILVIVGCVLLLVRPGGRRYY